MDTVGLSMEGFEVNDLKVNKDERGYVSEILRKEQLEEDKFGQIYISTANPGMVKGNHYHKRKLEWFFVVNGTAKIALKNLKTGETNEVFLSGEKPQILKVFPNVVHAIENVGKTTLYLIAYTSEPYNPDDTDTFPHKIL